MQQAGRKVVIFYRELKELPPPKWQSFFACFSWKLFWKHYLPLFPTDRICALEDCAAETELKLIMG